MIDTLREIFDAICIIIMFIVVIIIIIPLMGYIHIRDFVRNIRGKRNKTNT